MVQNFKDSVCKYSLDVRHGITRMSPLITGFFWASLISSVIGMGLLMQPAAAAFAPATDLEARDILAFKHLAEASYLDGTLAQHPQRDGGWFVDDGIPNHSNRYHKYFFYGDSPRSVGTVYSSRDYLVVACHGSLWNRDWVNNARLNPMDAQGLMDDPDPTRNWGHIHSGFGEIATAAYPDMMACIQEALRTTENDFPGAQGNFPGNRGIVFTGHSLGGAVATLLAAKFKCEQGQMMNDTRVIAFSPPLRLMGDQAFKRAVEAHLGLDNMLSFVTCHDVVTMPLPIGRSWPAIGAEVQTSALRVLADASRREGGLRNLEVAIKGTPQDFWRYIQTFRPIIQPFMKVETWENLENFFSAAYGSGRAVLQSVDWHTVANTLLASLRALHEIPSDQHIDEAFLRKQRSVTSRLCSNTSVKDEGRLFFCDTRNILVSWFAFS